MAEFSTLLRVFNDYSQTITGDYDIGEVLYRLTDQATEVLKLDGAGVSLADTDGRLQFVSATDERVVRIEEQQILTGQGSCQDASASGKRWCAPTSIPRTAGRTIGAKH